MKFNELFNLTVFGIIAASNCNADSNLHFSLELPHRVWLDKATLIPLMEECLAKSKQKWNTKIIEPWV